MYIMHDHISCVSCLHMGNWQWNQFEYVAYVFLKSKPIDVLISFIYIIYWAISFIVDLLALGQSYDCPSACEVTLRGMDKPTSTKA